MIRHLKLSLVVFFCFVVASAFFWTSTEAQETPAEKVFKNIQALKGFPASQMTVLMEHFNKALGVECTYCHVENALEKGDKPAHKKTLDEIRMTRDIATRYKTSLDCMSCHQGKRIPPSSPMAGLFAKNVTGGPAQPNNRQPDTKQPETKTTTTKPDTKPADTPTEAAPPGDDVVMRASFGRVPFPHARHMSAVSDCATCHHTGENNKCSVCHQKTPSAVTKVRMQDAAHNRTSQRACAGCHLSMKVGPTQCATCHKK